MWPWGHVAVGYLAYTGLLRRKTDEAPLGPDAWTVVLATQLPDLVDKPLAWTVHFLPNGRSLAHSLLVGTLVVAVVGHWLSRRDHDRLAAAFAVGYLSHLFADALLPLLTGRYRELGFLGWPLVPPIEYSTRPSILAHLASVELTPYVAFQLGLAVLAAAVWVHDGAPGLVGVRRWLAEPSG